jgi:hypothetical protein
MGARTHAARPQKTARRAWIYKCPVKGMKRKGNKK